jgi:hypothetical protein
MSDGGTSILYVLEYFAGFPIFGLIYWILNGILVDISVVSTNSVVTDFSSMIWTGSLVIYIIVGALWLPSKIKELKGGIK